MVAWQPNWSNVDFDYDGAADAIARARRCRWVLEDRGRALGTALSEARREWRGRHRERFDADEQTLAWQTHSLIDALQTAEFQVQVAIDEAHAEQGRRIAERARWHDEVRAEEAHARAMAEAADRRAAEEARRVAEEAARRPPTGTTVPAR